MDKAIVAAAIGAGATIVAAVLPLLPLVWKGIAHIKDSRRYRLLPKETANSLQGTWVGFTFPTSDPENRKYKVNIRFEPKGRILRGQLTVVRENPANPPENKGWRLDFVGGVIREGFLQLDYWHPDQNIRQFGSIIYEMRSPHVLEGVLIAYGRDLNQLLFGHARLEKQEP